MGLIAEIGYIFAAKPDLAASSLAKDTPKDNLSFF
jgi:hypothetical protein